MERAHVAYLDSPPLLRYGLPELVHGEAPAAAADYVKQVGGSHFARLVSVFCRLVTDSNVAAREVVLEYRDQENHRYALAGAAVTVAASTTIDYAFNAFAPESAWPCDSTILVPLPASLLAPTDNFRLHIVNVQAADALSLIRFRWELFYSDSPVPG